MRAADEETLSRLAEAGGDVGLALETEPVENQYLAIDAVKALAKLRDLETQLSTHQRHNTIPLWANSVIPRLDNLEGKLASFMTSEPHALSSSLSSSSVTSSSAAASYSTLQEDFTTKVEEMRGHFNESIESLEDKMSRFKGFIKLRPTTTDISKVDAQIKLIKSEIQGSVANVSVSIYSLIEDKVLQELEKVTGRLTTSEKTAEKGIEGADKKAGRYHSIIEDLRADVEQKILTSTKEQQVIKNHFATFDPRYTKIDERVAKTGEECKLGFEGARAVQTLALQNSTEFKASIGVSLNKLDGIAKTENTNISTLKGKIETKDMAQTARFEKLSDSVQDFLMLYDYDKGLLYKDLTSLKDIINEKQTKTLEEHNDYLNQLKAADIMAVVNAQEEAIEKIFKSLEDFERRLKTQNDIIKEVETMNAQICEEMESFPEHVAAHTSRMVTLQSLLDTATAEMSSMKSSFDNVTTQVSELFEMSTDVADVKNMGERARELVENVQKTLDSIDTMGKNHDKLIKKVKNRMEVVNNHFEDTLMEAIDNLKEEISGECAQVELKVTKTSKSLDVVASKQAEYSFDKLNDSSLQGNSLDPSSVLGEGIENLMPAGPTMAQRQLISDMCCTYEGLGGRYNTVPQMPPSICEQLMRIAEDVTRHATASTDKDAVRMLLQGQEEAVESVSLQEKTRKKLEDFVEVCKSLVESRAPRHKVRPIQQDCRDEYFDKLMATLNSYLSTHDQVLVVGNSRFGRTRIPTHSAGNDMRKTREVLIRSREINQNVDAGAKIDSTESATSSSINNTSSVYASKANVQGGVTQQEEQSVQTWSRLPVGAEPIAPVFSSGSISTKPLENPKYVMKAGFKMPVGRPNPSFTNFLNSVSLPNASVLSGKFDDDSTVPGSPGSPGAIDVDTSTLLPSLLFK